MSLNLPAGLRAVCTLTLNSRSLSLRPINNLQPAVITSARFISKKHQKRTWAAPSTSARTEDSLGHESVGSEAVSNITKAKNDVTDLVKPHDRDDGPETRSSQDVSSGLKFRSDRDWNNVDLKLTKPFPTQDLSSTRPAVLEVPEPLNPDDFAGNVPIQEQAKYYFRLGKSYLSFYKTGMKNIYSNYKEYREIKQRLGPLPINDAVKYGGQGGRPSITRREYQLYLRTRYDLTKLVPFGLVFLICGEFTPLVVLALGSAVVPYTCRIPKQIHADQAKQTKRWLNPKWNPSIEADNSDETHEKRTEERDTNSKSDTEIIQTRQGRVAAQLHSLLDAGSNPNHDAHSKPLPSIDVQVAYLWGISPFPRVPKSLEFPLSRLWLHARVKQRAEEILCDAILVQREGGAARLEPAEVLEVTKKANAAYAVLYLMEGRAEAKGDLDQQHMKKTLAPTLEEEMQDMFKVCEELHDQPDLHYLAAMSRKVFS